MPNEHNCPSCGRFMETFDTESGAKVLKCVSAIDDNTNRHTCDLTFYPDKDEVGGNPQKAGGGS